MLKQKKTSPLFFLSVSRIHFSEKRAIKSWFLLKIGSFPLLPPTVRSLPPDYVPIHRDSFCSHISEYVNNISPLRVEAPTEMVLKLNRSAPGNVCENAGKVRKLLIS